MCDFFSTDSTRSPDRTLETRHHMHFGNWPISMRRWPRRQCYFLTVGKRKSLFALGHLPKQNEFVRLDQRGELAWVARVILGAEELEELGQEEDHLECAKEFQ